jgi:allantoate deiminase
MSDTKTTDPLSGERILQRLKALARHTDVGGEMTRLSLSPSHRRAADEVIGLFRAAGLDASIDALGSVVGRRPAARNDARTLLIGSHIDTVPNGGIYDGILGVMTGLAVVERLNAEGRRLPFSLEVMAFSDEEGVRFPSTLTASRAVAGSFDPAALDEKDRDGISRREALKDFGCDPDGWPAVARDPATLVGFLEVHIEQGPVLESAGEALGVVSAIAGVSRGKVHVRGKAGHAGTTPMHMRRDALTAAAEMILMIEKLGQETLDLVATVGVATIRPGAVNVIPGEASFSYDIRSARDPIRVRAVATALGRCREIAEGRGVEVEIEMSYAQPAAVCDDGLKAALASGIGATAGVEEVLSGAGHDAMAFRNVCPQAMLFVRSRDGLSHHPDEFSTEQDIGRAAEALYGAVLALAEAEPVS